MKFIINGIEKEVPNTEGASNKRELLVSDMPTQDEVIQVIKLSFTIAEAIKILVAAIRSVFKK